MILTPETLNQRTANFMSDTETVTDSNLTKREIVLSIFEKTAGQIQQNHIRDTVQMTLDAIGEALLAGRNVELRNFGVFEVQIRKARVGRNPNKPETDVVIPRRAVVKFKAGKELKAGLKKLDLDTASN